MKVILLITLLFISINPLFSPNYQLKHVNVYKPIQKLKRIEFCIEKYNSKILRLERSKYNSVNELGCIGVYQFAPITLKHFKVDIDIEEFKKNPEIFPIDKQVKLFVKYTKYHEKLLQKYINKYDNTYHNGIYVTKAGILAMAHLSGVGGVKAYFNKGITKKDMNGTSVTKYLKEFENG